jgi:hypothetical protein
MCQLLISQMLRILPGKVLRAVTVQERLIIRLLSSEYRGASPEREYGAARTHAGSRARVLAPGAA